MAKNLNTLAKELDFQFPEQYFEYCVESFINGQRSQCKSLFNKMKKEDKHGLIDYIRGAHGNDEMHNYFVSLF